MLRNAYRLLKGVPRDSARVSADVKRDALKKLFHLYNEQGLTSIADRNAGSSRRWISTATCATAAS